MLAAPLPSTDATGSPSPGISVVMSVYNGERFLRESIESVLVQTFAEFELIIIDDGSTDSTPQILSEYASRDRRVVVQRQTNQGRAVALNRGFELAGAPLVARLDADDVALPDRLERQWRFFAEHDAVAVLGGAVTFVDANGRSFADYQYPLTDAEIRRAFSHTTPFVHSAVTLRKPAFERAGGYRPLFVPAEDVDLWLRIAEQHELANLPEGVVRYRMHGDQETVRRFELQTLCVVAARAAARTRAAGYPDPFADAKLINRQALIDRGVTPAEITAEQVRAAAWLAKTMGRAGYADAENELFAEAAAWARSAFGSRTLVAYVHRQRARRYAEQGSKLRARVTSARAEIAARRG